MGQRNNHKSMMDEFTEEKDAQSSGLYRILLAEDDIEMRKMLEWTLNKKGYQVINCVDGNDLMKKLGLMGPHDKDGFYDLIISDVRMPGVTGLEVMEKAKENENFPPFILITAFPDPHTIGKAERLGAKAIFAKPFDIDELISKVFQIIPPENTLEKLVSNRLKADPPFPLEISFRHSYGAEHVKSYIQDIAENLNSFSSYIEYVRVVIDDLNPNKDGGKHRYDIKVQVKIPGAVISADHDTEKVAGLENLFMGIHFAFESIIRQLKKHIKKRRDRRSRKNSPVREVREDNDEHISGH